jgi:transcriptional regulator with XRE-family HTH domain
MSNIVNNLEARLARRIQQERERKAWSLAELAEASGVSKAMISKIERNEVSPTATLLGKLSAAFGLTLSTLLSEDAPTASRLRKRLEQELWTDPESGQRRTTLSPAASKHLQLVLSELPPGARIDYSSMSYKFIQQQIWVLNGTLTFHEGETVHELAEGDCLELSEPANTSFQNKSNKVDCRYLVAITPRHR